MLIVQNEHIIPETFIWMVSNVSEAMVSSITAKS